jgi:hypothetical protein
MREKEECRAQTRQMMHARKVKGEGSFVVRDDGEDARGDRVALIPLVLRVKGVRKSKENVGIVGKGVLGF